MALVSNQSESLFYYFSQLSALPRRRAPWSLCLYGDIHMASELGMFLFLSLGTPHLYQGSLTDLFCLSAAVHKQADCASAFIELAKWKVGRDAWVLSSWLWLPCSVSFVHSWYIDGYTDILSCDCGLSTEKFSEEWKRDKIIVMVSVLVIDTFVKCHTMHVYYIPC